MVQNKWMLGLEVLFGVKEVDKYTLYVMHWSTLCKILLYLNWSVYVCERVYSKTYEPKIVLTKTMELL